MQSVPKLTFPGGALIGCSAGFVNVPRIKGSHNAMKTGMLAAEAAFAALAARPTGGDELTPIREAYRSSWVCKDLRQGAQRQAGAASSGTVLGTLLGGFDMWCHEPARQSRCSGRCTTARPTTRSTGLAKDFKPIAYPKPDGVLSASTSCPSVFLSNTNHEEDQPAHLKLKDPSIPIAVNLPLYAEPAQRLLPGRRLRGASRRQRPDPRFQINAQNCVHCKTCDIKDPAQNIDWTTPQGGGGPNYPNM